MKPMNEKIDPEAFWKTFVVNHAMSPQATYLDKMWPDYISYKPDIKEYEGKDNYLCLMQRSTHTGEIINTYNLLWQTLQPLVQMKVMGARMKGKTDFNAIKYEIIDFSIECKVSDSVIIGGKRQRGNVETATIKALCHPFVKGGVVH